MKGIVFTEFIEMVEQRYGYALIDDIINTSNLPSEGAYTAVGTYDPEEMNQLVHGLSQRTQLPEDVLLKTYGRHLFGVFTKNYAHFFDEMKCAFDCLEQIDGHIHVEVKKLYPDAELPKFETKRLSETTLEMIYISQRKLSDFASGLIEATFDYYKEKATIQKTFLEPDGSKVKFIIRKL